MFFIHCDGLQISWHCIYLPVKEGKDEAFYSGSTGKSAIMAVTIIPAFQVVAQKLYRETHGLENRISRHILAQGRECLLLFF